MPELGLAWSLLDSLNKGRDISHGQQWLEECALDNHIHPESQEVILFGNRAFAEVIMVRTVILDCGGPYPQRVS